MQLTKARKDIQFAAAVYTNLSQDHSTTIIQWKSMKVVKSQGFANAQVAIINGDDPWAPLMIQKSKKVIRFGLQSRI